MIASGCRTAIILSLFGMLVVGCDSGGSPGSNREPAVTISSPSGQAEFVNDETISFEGSADDPEDGSLTEDALVWTSSADGEFGSGEQVTTSSLSATQHTITLTATDSDGATGQDSISISVQDGPTVNISSPSDETAVDQESTVELEGSGTSADGSELSGHDLGWSSDVDGRLGTGESISVMDLSQGPHTITLTATDDEGISASESVDILVESPGFDIRVRLLDDFTSSEEAAIRNGLEPWTTAITEDLSPVFPSPELAKRCSLVEGEGIDDLVVNVTTRPDEGFSGLAAGIPCGVRDDEGNLTTSISGIVFINEAELDHPQLEDIIIHEVGHTLGIGVAEAWTTNESDMDTRDPFHAGPNTREAFNRLGGEAYLSEGVPISPGHWREENFGTELMTPFLDEGSPNPLSRVTIATLADIGYEVDRSAADSYVLPMPQEAIWLAEADATLGRSSLASQNFGQPSGSRLDTTLVAGANVDSLWTDEAPEDEIFSGLVQFGVPSSLPMGVNVEEAELLLTVGDRKTDTTDHNIGVFSVSESWSEEMVTWDSRPAVEDTPVTTFEHQSCEDCRVDLTGLSTDWVSGDTPNHGVALRAPDAPSAPTFSIGFASRHFETSSSDSTGIVASSRPRIVVKASTSEAALKAGFRRSSGEKVFLGNDIPSGMMIYGVSPDGRIVQTKRIR